VQIITGKTLRQRSFEGKVPLAKHEKRNISICHLSCHRKRDEAMACCAVSAWSELLCKQTLGVCGENSSPFRLWTVSSEVLGGSPQQMNRMTFGD